MDASKLKLRVTPPGHNTGNYMTEKFHYSTTAMWEEKGLSITYLIKLIHGSVIELFYDRTCLFKWRHTDTATAGDSGFIISESHDPDVKFELGLTRHGVCKPWRLFEF